jgi:hypothetical protein
MLLIHNDTMEQAAVCEVVAVIGTCSRREGMFWCGQWLGWRWT